MTREEMRSQPQSERRAARPALIAALLVTSALALSGCKATEELGRLKDRLSGADKEASGAVTGPQPDSRGVISYPTYQVVVAKRGETVAQIAARLGMSSASLAQYNGLKENYTTREGELLALPPGAVARMDTAGTGVITTTELDAAPGADPTGSAGAPAGDIVRHTVVPGETAFTIARLYGVSVTALASWNKLDRDLNVREGQELLIPTEASAQTATQAPTSAPQGQSMVEPPVVPPSAATSTPTSAPATTAPTSQSTGASSSTSSMMMPVQGKVLRGYSDAPGGNEGLDIAASAGTPVKAAAAGTVALISESSAQNTIILIRHPNNIYTVYSKVTDARVSKGDQLAKGQQIGVVAKGDPAFVHFEIRNGTESVDPLPYLK